MKKDEIVESVCNPEEKDNKKASVIMGRKKRRQKKLVLMILLLLVTGVMLGTSTYAWFTSNKTVNVNNIKVNVAAQNGIQISVDGTSWKSIVQSDDIKGATAKYKAAVNQIPNAIEPVSTVGKMGTDGKMEMFHGVIDTNEGGDYILTATKSVETPNNDTGKFIAFDLFFKVDGDTDVYMTSTSGVKADGTDKGIKNASRMAFAVLGNTTAGATLADVQALNAGAASPVSIWEPNYDVHQPAAVSHARDTYGITTTENGADAIGYSGIKADITKENNVLVGNATAEKNATLFDAVTPSFKTTEGNTTNFKFLTLTSGITKVRVYMWVEGQDVDCENNASGGNIEYNLQITTDNT